MGRRKATKTKYPGIYKVHGQANMFQMRIKTQEVNTGKVREAMRLHAGTIQEAVEERLRLIEALKQPVATDPSNPTVIEYVERFVKRRAPGWKRSHREYMGAVLGSAADAFGGLLVRDVLPEHIQRWLINLEGRHGGAAAASTMKSYLMRVRTVFEMAVYEGLIERNPAHPYVVKAPRGRGRREGIALTPEQCQRLLAAAVEYDAYLERLPGSPHMGHRVYFAMALTTGLRSGELTALRWDSHVNLGARTLDVVVSHWHGTLDTRKTGRRDTLYLPQALVEDLGEHWRLLQSRGSKPQRESGLVFPSRNGKLATSRARTALSWCCEHADLPRMTPHDLRHTATTLWAQAAPRRVSQLVIGHDDNRTHDHYTHPYEDEFRRGSNVVAGLIGLTASPHQVGT